ncbi:MAG: proline racemase family protein [Pseudomonadota bacterium]
MHVIDSHTVGEPTRVILDGGPDLGDGPLAERARRLQDDHLDFCRSVLREPRGQPAMVGALVVPPTDPDCIAGVIFFEADMLLGMCGHGAMGLGVTLAHLGRISLGNYAIETPAGIIDVTLHDTNTVTVTNVESRRVRKGVSVDVEGLGSVKGDVAYGGNWFFIIEPSPIPLETRNIGWLASAAAAIRASAIAAGIGGEDGQPVDHVIFHDRSDRHNIHSRSFVLCPDDTYDRSPCGTGCSARLACLWADGRIAPDEEITLESIIGSTYRASCRPGPSGGIVPKITGKAWVMAESQLLFHEDDPYRRGISL